MIVTESKKVECGASNAGSGKAAGAVKTKWSGVNASGRNLLAIMHPGMEGSSDWSQSHGCESSQEEHFSPGATQVKLLMQKRCGDPATGRISPTMRSMKSALKRVAIHPKTSGCWLIRKNSFGFGCADREAE